MVEKMSSNAVSYSSYVDADGMIHFGQSEDAETLCGTPTQTMDHWRKFYQLSQNVCPFCQRQYHRRNKEEVSKKSGD